MIHVGDFKAFSCPADAALVLVDPPFALGKVYAGQKERNVGFEVYVNDVLAWSTAPWTLIVAPLPTMREWLPQVSPTRILWWCKTFAQVRRNTTWQYAVTPILVYMRDGAPWYYPRGLVPDWIVCCNAMADNRHITGVKHPGITGTPIATELILPLTRAGDLVVDPMCGCGSILVAAHRLGRRVWGCEIESEYAAIARGWLSREGKGDAP